MLPLVIALLGAGASGSYATQTCPDGSVIAATATCAAPPQPFQPQLVCVQPRGSDDYPAQLLLGLSPDQKFVLMVYKLEYPVQEKPAGAPKDAPDVFRSYRGVSYRFTVGQAPEAMRQRGEVPVLVQRSIGNSAAWQAGKQYSCKRFDPRTPVEDDEYDAW